MLISSQLLAFGLSIPPRRFVRGNFVAGITVTNPTFSTRSSQLWSCRQRQLKNIVASRSKIKAFKERYFKLFIL
jgi:hypothetical protein